MLPGLVKTDSWFLQITFGLSRDDILQDEILFVMGTMVNTAKSFSGNLNIFVIIKDAEFFTSGQVKNSLLKPLL